MSHDPGVASCWSCSIKALCHLVDGKLAACLSHGFIEIWILLYKECVIIIKIGRNIKQCIFQFDNGIIALNYIFNNVIFWNAQTSTNVGTLRGHQSSIYGLIPLRDGNLFML